MQVSEIQLFQILRQKLGEKEAEALVEYVDLKLKENNEVNSKILSTKEDIANLRVEIERRFTEQFKWMFVFTVTQTFIIIGVILAVLNHIR